MPVGRDAYDPAVADRQVWNSGSSSSSLPSVQQLGCGTSTGLILCWLSVWLSCKVFLASLGTLNKEDENHWPHQFAGSWIQYDGWFTVTQQVCTWDGRINAPCHVACWQRSV